MGPLMMDVKKILVIGSSGLIGSSVLSTIRENYETVGLSRNDMDVLDTAALSDFIHDLKIDTVINAAGKVAGIQGNIDAPADLLIQNSLISNSVLQACHKNEVRNYIQFASACVYPINRSDFAKPEDIGTGAIEETSRSYAAAKILAIEAVIAFTRQYGYAWSTLIPSNVYGPGDWHSGKNGHVISMLTNRIVDAIQSDSSEIIIWGDGKSTRNFLHVNDLANAVNFLLSTPVKLPPVVNVNGYEENSILDITKLISELAGFGGEIRLDTTRPSGAKRKNLDDSFLRQIGWHPVVSTRDGLSDYIRRYTTH